MNEIPYTSPEDGENCCTVNAQLALVPPTHLASRSQVAMLQRRSRLVGAGVGPRAHSPALHLWGFIFSGSTNRRRETETGWAVHIPAQGPREPAIFQPSLAQHWGTFPASAPLFPLILLPAWLPLHLCPLWLRPWEGKHKLGQWDRLKAGQNYRWAIGIFSDVSVLCLGICLFYHHRFIF